MRHRVGLVLPPNFQLLDVAGPMAVFESAIEVDGSSKYEMTILTESGGTTRSSSGALLETTALELAGNFDTLLLCGGLGAAEPGVDPRVTRFIGRHVERRARIGSICTGAFVLAEAGCLEGRPATTHWRYCDELASRYPGIEVQPDRIWTRDGHVWTSAGVSAGIDLALAMLAEDLGATVAKGIARELVVYYRRPGGQAQFSALLESGEPAGRFTALLGWVRENLHHRLSVEALAGKASMSPRNFSRAFRKETGMSPARAIERIRIDVAREWLARATHSSAHIALATGFGSTDRMRNAFVRCLGMTPQAIRRSF